MAQEIAKVDAPADDVQETEDKDNIDSIIKSLEAQVIDVKKTATNLLIGLKLVKKQSAALSKQAQRANRPRKKRTEVSENRKASGFAAASILSSTLKNFMGIGQDELRSRTEVTKFLCKYISDNGLQGKEDKRYILFDGEAGRKLKEVLNCENSSITYFDLQHYLKFHMKSKNNTIDDSVTVPTDNSLAVVDTVETTETPLSKKPARIRTRPVVS